MRIRETKEVKLIWEKKDEEVIKPWMDYYRKDGWIIADKYLSTFTEEDSQSYITYRKSFLYDTFREEEE